MSKICQITGKKAMIGNKATTFHTQKEERKERSM